MSTCGACLDYIGTGYSKIPYCCKYRKRTEEYQMESTKCDNNVPHEQYICHLKPNCMAVLSVRYFRGGRGNCLRGWGT